MAFAIRTSKCEKFETFESLGRSQYLLLSELREGENLCLMSFIPFVMSMAFVEISQPHTHLSKTELQSGKTARSQKSVASKRASKSILFWGEAVGCVSSQYIPNKSSFQPNTI